MIDTGKNSLTRVFLIILGSGWLWVFKDDCQGALKADCDNGQGYKFYSYYDGSIAGPIANTSISLGNDVSKPQYFIVVE